MQNYLPTEGHRELTCPWLQNKGFFLTALIGEQGELVMSESKGKKQVKNPRKKPNSRKISLYPLRPEEAIKAVLEVPLQDKHPSVKNAGLVDGTELCNSHLR